MRQQNPLKKLRMNIAFVTGLTAAAGIAMAVDKTAITSASRLSENPNMRAATELMTKVERRDLSPAEREAAKLAWVYIENNTQASSGLVNSVDGFPSTTLWDLGSYLFALTAAKKLGIISRAELLHRSERLVITLKNLPLVDGRLPNKVYNTQTLAMTDYENNLTPNGIGWSALDLGRLLLALANLRRTVPEHNAVIGEVIDAWQLSALVRDGFLVGSRREPSGELSILQEGRLGYEQYAARAVLMYGLDAMNAVTAFEKMSWQKIEGVDVPIDLRSFRDYGAVTPILSEPFFLTALEMGLDSESKLLAFQVYSAQEQRFKKTGTRTFVSEDHIDQAPYFLYSTVYGNGSSWAVLSENGQEYPALRTISLKSAFAWNAIYNTEYTSETLASLNGLALPGRGWPAGRFEISNKPNSALSLNTNAVVLEAMHYSVFGPFLNLNN